MLEQQIVVSVIMPCYNCATVLHETLESLEAQTYRDFEIIAINDGSSDHTLDILREWEKSSKFRLRVLTQENCGVSKTRNRGIEAAKGRYILFLDSDDIYHKEFIQRMIEAIEEGNADVSYCRLIREIEEVRQNSITDFHYQLQTQKEAMDKLLFEMPQYGFYCYLYRRDVLMNCGLRFDEGTRYFEDREFNWKYLCHCQRFAWIDIAMYGYRVTENSAMRKKTSWERSIGSLNAVKRVEQYMEECQCSYLAILKSYLYQRVMWGVLKNIALSDDKNLYQRFCKEFDVKSCMKRTSKDSNKLVSIASWCYRIHPMLFYNVVRLKK